jgi:hypothetical protein
MPIRRWTLTRSEEVQYRGLTERMRAAGAAFGAILNEVDLLNSAGDRIEGLAEHDPPVSEALISIAGMFAVPRRYWQCWWRQSCDAGMGASRFLRSRSKTYWAYSGRAPSLNSESPSLLRRVFV